MIFFDDTPQYERALEVRKRVDTRNLLRLEYAQKQRPISTDPFSLPVGSEVVFDVECFRNYFMVGFKHLETGLYFFLEGTIYNPLRTDLLTQAMWHFKLIGFNSRTYDLPMLEAAMRGYDVSELKDLSDGIIQRNERKANPNSPFNHVDLFEVAPLEGSLKLYAARLQGERIQELPMSEDTILTEQDMLDCVEYNFNDLDCTELLYVDPKYGLRGHIQMREMLGAEIGEDIRSKSDAQVAESFINARLKAITGKRPQTPQFPEGYNFKYKAPDWVQFRTPQMQAAFEVIKNATFYLEENGRPAMPASLEGLTIEFGACTYKLGMGGLHSSEKTVAHIATDEFDLIDRDVASYYPWIIILNKLFPEHLGPAFLTVYRDDLVIRRLKLKELKDKLEAGLKIAINGTFGKLGNVYSTIYSPNLLMQVTLTGQLGLLMFIEMLELEGIPVVSANTDGVVMKCPKSKHNVYQMVVAMWEQATGFKTEETRYKATYARDVNNYIAIMEDGTCKTKGYYSEKGSAQNSALSKNPEALICSDAVKAFLSAGTPIADTVRRSTDIRRFIVVRNVRGGAHKDGYFLGKTVRWYYSKYTAGTINYVTSGNKVPKSDNARPLMELNGMPDDLDFDYYVRRCEEMLAKLGVYGNATRQVSFF